MRLFKEADSERGGGGAAPPETLIDQLLAEQRRLQTPAAEFASHHDRSPDYLKQWHRLIPLTRPGEGEQYAFEVNLDACTGCKACVAACHSLNGLDEEESWRDTGTITSHGSPYIQTVTTACHHCADPACLNGCPTMAYEKDPATGVVRHLDDQCMGCSYCILKCPYDVPKYNRKRGIVRKCDLCQGRLAQGEAPACVQACPGGAIAIRTVKRADVASRAGIPLLPGAFPSDYTLPATRYVSSRPVPEPAGAAEDLSGDHAHSPLAVMLILTQMAAGGFLFAALGGDLKLGAAAAVILFAGLAASVLHLGRPSKAWKAFLGWRRSWLSREIIAFNGMAGLAVAVLACAALPVPAVTASLALWSTAGAGALAVFTSTMVYADTRRPFWSVNLTGGKFAGTALLLGASSAAAMWAWTGHAGAGPAALTAWGLRLALSGGEFLALRAALHRAGSPWHRSALVMTRLQRGWMRARFLLLILAGLLLPAAALFFPSLAPGILTAIVVSNIGSQLIERHQFFTAAAGPFMPGCRPS